MFQSIAQVRRWLVIGAVVLIAGVVIAYWVARSRVAPTLHDIPKNLGFDVQQTSNGFSLSKSEAGHTIYTIRASKAVQFKTGGHAELRDVHITIYGHSSDRYDQIYGDKFTYDSQTGEVKADGEVHIDLQANTEGPSKPDQSVPAELKNPLHLLTSQLSFNQKTGIAQTDAPDPVQHRSSQRLGQRRLLRLQEQPAAAEIGHPRGDHRRPSRR